jgi:hypothetical protein
MLTLKKPVTQQRQSQSQPKTPMPEQQRAEDANGHDEEIRPLAYQKWQEAGCPEGDGVQYWLAAEKEILRRQR